MIIILYAVFLFLGLIILLDSFFIVKQQTSGVIERLGKFHSIRSAGFNIKIPIFDRRVGTVSLKVRQLDVQVETKSKDNVFLKIQVSVQYVVQSQSVYNAFYKLSNPQEQITSYVFDTIRAEVPKMKLDDVFERKDDLAIATKREIQEAMTEYGYTIIKALVTDIDPNEEVKGAMNHINSAERQKIAAEYEGEAERIRIVAKAKAEAESKQLQGQGIANQRREIAKGLEDSVNVLNKVGINSQEASALIVITQHYDTLQNMGENVNSNLILLPNSPNSANDLLTNMIASLSATKNIVDKIKKDK